MSGNVIEALLGEIKTALPAQGGARVLFMNAQDAPLLRQMRDAGVAVTCQQDFRPHAAALERAGFPPLDRARMEGDWTHILLHAPKQMAEMRYEIACALDLLDQAGGGGLYVASANDAGGKRLPGLMGDLGLSAHSVSRNHARVVICTDIFAYDRDLAARWRADGAARFLEDMGFYSQPGLFSWDRIDRASALLMRHVPPLAGRGADFGCGYGYLSHALLSRGDGVAALYCVDADARALACARRNLESVRGACALHFEWLDLPSEIGGATQLDWVIMNPPFHEGARTRTDIGVSFIQSAHKALKRGGTLYMVANVHLPYEKIVRELFSACDKIYEGDGFKILSAVK